MYINNWLKAHPDYYREVYLGHRRIKRWRIRLAAHPVSNSLAIIK
jgi:hypothetical protein